MNNQFLKFLYTFCLSLFFISFALSMDQGDQGSGRNPNLSRLSRKRIGEDQNNEAAFQADKRDQSENNLAQELQKLHISVSEDDFLQAIRDDNLVVVNQYLITQKSLECVDHALSLAIVLNRTEIFTGLLERLSIQNQITLLERQSVSNQYRLSWLHIAIQNNNLACCQAILRPLIYWPNILSVYLANKNNEQNLTPLELAQSLRLEGLPDSEEIFKLLQYVTGLVTERLDFEKLSQEEQISFLLNTQQFPYKFKHIHFAIRFGDLTSCEIILNLLCSKPEVLLDYLNDNNNDGHISAIEYARCLGNGKIIELLDYYHSTAEKLISEQETLHIA